MKIFESKFTDVVTLAKFIANAVRILLQVVRLFG